MHNGVDLLRSQRGLMSKVATACGITRAAVAMWKRIPADYVPKISEVSGIPRHELRPDLWEKPGREAP